MARRLKAGAIALIATAVVMSMSFAGAALAQTAAPSASGAPSDGSTFTWAATTPPSSLNPLVGYLGLDYTQWALNYDLLINFAPDFSPDMQHSITTSVDVSSDSMSFTYHLRSGMKWSDGEPFTANDVAWTLNYYKANNVSNYSSDLQLMDTATATDDTTVTITSTVPTTLYSGATVFMYEYILPEHIWSKFPDYHTARQFENVPSVGSGPYIITKYVKDQYVELDKNPLYWGLQAGLTPHVDRVVYQIFGNQDAEAAALQAGQIDYASIDSANILNTLKARGMETRGAVIPSFGEIGVNTGSAYQTDPAGGFKAHGDGNPALTDPVVRQAIRRAVDNKFLVDKVLLGYGQPGVSPVQPDATTGAWTPGPSDPDLSFSISGANQLLDSGGYKLQDPSQPPGDSNLRVDPKTGKTLEFRFFSRSTDQNSIDIVPYVQDWLKQIGIKIVPTTITSAKLGNVILEGNYDLFEWGWYPNPDPNYILDIFACDQRPPDSGTYRNSDSYYCNPAYDALYKQQQQATDPAKRADIVHQMQSILYKDEPYVVLWNDQALQAWSPEWTGFVSQPPGNGDILATYGPFSFISLHKVTGTTATPAGSSGGIPSWVCIAVAGVVVVVIVIVVVTRGRGENEDEA